MSNTLQALYRAAQVEKLKLVDVYTSKNRANAMGDALEEFVKDVYAGSDVDHADCFSYIGNPNHPPDFILKNGDAVEVKKVEGFGNALALNSSYPKSKLHVDDSRISQACRDCEQWAEKDIVYVVGCVPDSELRLLYFVYGDCYAACRETYESIVTKVRDAIVSGNIETENTNELAKVRRVDPLGITSLRVRGMWHIEHPSKVFRDVYDVDQTKQFQIVCLMKTEKYSTFPKEDRHTLENMEGFSVADIRIPFPDNPAKQIDATLISYSR